MQTRDVRCGCQNGGVSPSRKPAVVRGFVASSVATFAALAGHVIGGGQMPGGLGIVIPWILSLMICVLLAGRKLSVIRLTLSVAISQFLFHVLFVLGTITPSGTVAPHVHGAPLVLPTGSASAADAIVADGAMWVGHIAAVIVTVAVLHRGERLLLALRDLAIQAVRWVRRRVDAALISPVLLVGRGVPALSDRVLSIDDPVLSSHRGRAPPLFSTI